MTRRLSFPSLINDMKILQIFNQYRFKGGEEAWVDTIPGLLGNSAEVEDLTFRSDDWLGADSPSKLRQIQLMGDNPASRIALRQKVERFQPDVLLFHNVIPVGSFGLYFEAKQLGLTVLQYTHNFRPFSPSGTLWNGRRVVDKALHGNPWPEIITGAWQGSRIKTAILAWHLQLARKRGLLDCIDHWLAISNFMRERFILAGIPEERISTLRHCWPLPDSSTPSKEDAHYLYLGRLVPEKGISTLLEAWSQLHKKLGSKCPTLVIAGDGPLKSTVHQASECNPHVQHIGFVSSKEKNEVLHKSKAVMVPSAWWEPLGLTTYEAYAHGRPVIASHVGALRETVIDGVTGWHHRAGDPKDLARAVMDAEDTGAEGRCKMGQQGKLWLEQNASQKEWRKALIGICGKLTRKKGLR